MATDDNESTPKNKTSDVVTQLREIANRLERNVGEEKMAKTAVVACCLAPCEEEGHKHGQVIVVVGGDGRLCVEAHRELTSRLLEVAPAQMFSALAMRLEGMLKPPVKPDQMN